MAEKTTLFITMLLMLFMASCIDEKNTEEEQPSIELLSPSPCDTLYFGEEFQYRAKITDNTGLGNISMDMHNNFGHHSHGDHETCSMDEAKDAVNPYTNSWIFTLPSEKKEYILDTTLSLPAMKNDTTLYDHGDYHFHIYVTDNDGYQIFTTLDVKVLNRE